MLKFIHGGQNQEQNIQILEPQKKQSFIAIYSYLQYSHLQSIRYFTKLTSLVPALLGSGPSSSALSGGWAPTSPPSPTLSGGGGRNCRNQLTIPWDFVRTSVKGCLSKSLHQACPGMVNLYLVRAWLNIAYSRPTLVASQNRQRKMASAIFRWP